MAIWYNANEKKYSSDGKESVTKSYIDERIAAEGVECEERLEAHAEGTSLRHSAEDVDYGGDKTVKEKIDDVKDALDTERTLRIAQGQDIMSEINDLRISSVYDNNALYNAIEVLKGPGDSESFGMVRTEGADGRAGKAFMCKASEAAQNLNNYIYTGIYYLKIYAYSQNLPTNVGYEMLSPQGDKAVLFVTECDGRVNQRFYCTDDGSSYERTGNTYGIFSAWKKTVSSDEFGSISDRMDYLDIAYHDLESTEHKGVANGYAPLDGNKKIPEQYIYGKTAKEYGIRWTGTSVTACTRLKDAAGLTAQAYRSEIQTYHSDFDNIYPWSDIKLCNIDENGQVTAYIGEPNFKRDGSNGDVMVEIPKFYYKRKKTGEFEEWWICGMKLPGYELHPAFTDGGEEVQKLFVGAYNGSVEAVDGTDKLMSKTSVIPINRKSLGTLRTYARNKGVNWGVEDYACLSALQMLYTVEFADMNSQNVLGKGITLLHDVEQLAAQIIEEATETNSVKIPYGKRNQFPVGSHIQIGTVLRTPDKTTNWRAVTNVVTDGTQSATVTFSGAPISVEENDYIWEECPENGACDFLGGQSGSPDTVYYKDVCYRGIEGIYGKIYQAIDGITIKGATSYYVSVTMSDYGDKKTTGTYEMLSFVPPAQGYITELGFDTYKPWAILPCAAGGSNNTYIPDYWWPNLGNNELFSGLSSKSNGGEGIFSLFAYGNITGNARLMFKK